MLGFHFLYVAIHFFTVVCMILRVLLWLCGLNILFNIEDVPGFARTVLFHSAPLDRFNEQPKPVQQAGEPIVGDNPFNN